MVFYVGIDYLFNKGECVAKPLKCDKDALIADWKTGKYSTRDLAKKHGVSHVTVHNLTKSLDKELEPLINSQVQINEKLAELNVQELYTFKQEVDERTKNTRFFKDANMIIASKVMKKLEDDGEKAKYGELNLAANTIAKTQEGVLGKQPDVQITNNNLALAESQSVSLATTTPEQIRAAYLELDSEY